MTLKMKEDSGDITPEELATLPILRGLSREELNVVVGDFGHRSVGAGGTIIAREDSNLEVYFLVEGRARVMHDTPLGRSVQLSELAEGSYFGELSAIDGLGRSAAVQAVTDCRLAWMTPDGFRRLLVAHPSVLVAVLQNLAAVIRRTNAAVLGGSIL
jgi:CRP/FNR family transcriptional regulator, cyclic AMP receptor protein